MTEPQDADDALLRERLRTADPAASLPPAAPEGVARLLEDTMSEDTLPAETREGGARGRSPLTWLVAAAAALVIGAVGGYAVLGDDDTVADPPVAQEPVADPTVTELSASGQPAGRCMPPNSSVLAGKPVAFDATVESVTDTTVTLVPSRWYAGEPTDLVTVDAPAEALTTLLSSVEFVEGERYLVAADEDGSVMVCGFSAPWSEGLETLYVEAFPG